MITLQITNTGAARTVNFSSWGEPSTSSQNGRPILLDNLGKSYRRKTIGSDRELAGHVRSAAIAPGQTVEDVLVFEAPAPEIVFLSLELPGSAVGLSGAFKLEIPRQMISY